MSAREGWWVYCAIAAADADRVPAVPGVAELTAVETVEHGELAAVVSPLPLPEFGEELPAHLEDIEWVERVARAHEAVLEETMAVTTVVPLRLCTIYLGRERVAGFLAAHDAELRGAMADLRGRTEWGVKVFAPAGGEPADEHAGSYLARRRAQLAAREEARMRAARCAEEVHERVRREAVAACVNAPQRPEAHGREVPMLLNGAYLVEMGHEPRLRAAIDALAGELGPRGYSIELTGPWPPYNFAAVR